MIKLGLVLLPNDCPKQLVEKIETSEKNRVKKKWLFIIQKVESVAGSPQHWLEEPKNWQRVNIRRVKVKQHHNTTKCNRKRQIPGSEKPLNK